MTGAEARADYRSALAEYGETIIVRRGAGSSAVEAPALARIIGWSPEELASGMMQGERKAILLVEDLERAAFPLPLRKGDGLYRGSVRMNVESVDDSTRRIGSTLIAYELGVEGG